MGLPWDGWTAGWTSDILCSKISVNLLLIESTMVLWFALDMCTIHAVYM